jgi:hypothetical protein
MKAHGGSHAIIFAEFERDFEDASSKRGHIVDAAATRRHRDRAARTRAFEAWAGVSGAAAAALTAHSLPSKMRSSAPTGPPGVEA